MTFTFPQITRQQSRVLKAKSTTRASIIYDNILRLSQDSPQSTLTGHFQYRENDKKTRNSPLVTHYLQVNQCEDNNRFRVKAVMVEVIWLNFISGPVT